MRILLLLIPGAVALAPPRPRCHFINLTNGLEALPVLAEQAPHLNFVRIQSSKCEANDFYGILADLDHNLLFRLASGCECVIYDYGSRRTAWYGDDPDTKIPRALWWGVEWVRYALRVKWRVDGDEGEDEAPPTFRGYNVKKLLDEKLARLPKPLSKKLRYYRKFGPTVVDLKGAYLPAGTKLDGNDEAYAAFAAEWRSGLDGDSDAPLPAGFRAYRSADYAGVGRGACTRKT